jgi:hypothetical protein
MQGRAVLGYDTTGDGRLDSFDTNQDGSFDVGATSERQDAPSVDSSGLHPGADTTYRSIFVEAMQKQHHIRLQDAMQACHRSSSTPIL